MTASRRRVLVALHEPGYFRFYGSTLVELERRGWEVQIAFDRPDKRDRALVPDHAGPKVTSLGALPDVPEGWLPSMRAAMDYVRYLEAPFGEAMYLRRRWEKTLPAMFRVLTKVARLPRFVVGTAIRSLRAIERLVPAPAAIARVLHDAAPDVLLVSPLVTPGRSGDRQTEIIKAARAARVPVIVGVASWDHLTSKGLVRVLPDVLMVWNQAQVEEAVDLHRVPKGRVVVTGAQSLDHWFVPVAPSSTDAFRAGLGIHAGRRVILYVGSSRNMAPGTSEVRFVRRWLDALRASSHPELRDAVVIVRPHPGNIDPWLGDAMPGVLVYPTSYSGIPMTDAEVEVFRQSLLVSDVVVGINTTAMIEAAILGRPVLTVRDDEFAHSQGQTLHFAYLPIEAGGCAQVATSLERHVDQLARVLRDPAESLDAARRFVSRFVRPLGAGEPATRHVCDVIERVASRQFPAATAVSQRAADDHAMRTGRAAS